MPPSTSNKSSSTHVDEPLNMILFADFSIVTTIKSCIADPSGQATTPTMGEDALTRGELFTH